MAQEVEKPPTELVDPISVNMEVVVKELRALKDRLEEVTKEEKQIRHEIKEFEKVILDQMNLDGIESFRTKHGLVMKKMKVYYSIGNYVDLCDFIQRTGHFELFHKRISTTAAQEIKENLGGEEVPGLSKYEEQVINFRRR